MVGFKNVEQKTNGVALAVVKCNPVQPSRGGGAGGLRGVMPLP